MEDSDVYISKDCLIREFGTVLGAMSRGWGNISI